MGEIRREDSCYGIAEGSSSQDTYECTLPQGGVTSAGSVCLLQQPPTTLLVGFLAAWEGEEGAPHVGGHAKRCHAPAAVARCSDHRRILQLGGALHEPHRPLRPTKRPRARDDGPTSQTSPPRGEWPRHEADDPTSSQTAPPRGKRPHHEANDPTASAPPPSCDEGDNGQKEGASARGAGRQRRPRGSGGGGTVLRRLLGWSVWSQFRGVMISQQHQFKEQVGGGFCAKR